MAELKSPEVRFRRKCPPPHFKLSGQPGLKENLGHVQNKLFACPDLDSDRRHIRDYTWTLKLVHIYLYFSDSEALKNAHISKQMKIPEHVFSKAIRLDTRKSIPNGGGVPYSVQCR